VAQEGGKRPNLKESKNGHPPPPDCAQNPLTLLSKNLAGYRLWLRWPAFQ
jgi:hypothetical protein